MSEKMGTQDFEKIYERYKTTLYRIAFTYLKNNADVEDVLQEVFLKRLYRHMWHEEQPSYPKRS